MSVKTSGLLCLAFHSLKRMRTNRPILEKYELFMISLMIAIIIVIYAVAIQQFYTFKLRKHL